MDGLDVINEGACEVVVNVGDDETTLGATGVEPSHTEAQKNNNNKNTSNNSNNGNNNPHNKKNRV